MSVPAVVDPGPTPVPPSPTGTVDIISSLISEVDKVVEDALSGDAHAETDLITLVVGAGGAVLQLGLISSQTNGIIAASATLGIAALWRIIALVRAGHKAKVKAAAFTAAGTGLRLIQGGK